MKPGDIVRWANPVRYGRIFGWGDGPFVVKYVTVADEDGRICVTISTMDGNDASSHYGEYLIPEVFLTAVKNAIDLKDEVKDEVKGETHGASSSEGKISEGSHVHRDL